MVVHRQRISEMALSPRDRTRLALLLSELADDDDRPYAVKRRHDRLLKRLIRCAGRRDRLKLCEGLLSSSRIELRRAAYRQLTQDGVEKWQIPALVNVEARTGDREARQLLLTAPNGVLTNGVVRR